MFGAFADLACDVSRRLSRALMLRDTAIFALPSLAESTLELPKSRPHLLPGRIFGATATGADDGDGEAAGDGTDATIRASSVSVSFAGS